MRGDLMLQNWLYLTHLFLFIELLFQEPLVKYSYLCTTQNLVRKKLVTPDLPNEALIFDEEREQNCRAKFSCILNSQALTEAFDFST
jgi:hypothetical protein